MHGFSYLNFDSQIQSIKPYFGMSYAYILLKYPLASSEGEFSKMYCYTGFKTIHTYVTSSHVTSCQPKEHFSDALQS